MKYELFLDESGSFDYQRSRQVPSLVGGYLAPKGSFTKEKAFEILKQVKEANKKFKEIGIRPFHAKDIEDNELYVEFMNAVISKMLQAGARFVIFQNNERLDIVNGDITYLNIFSSGVSRLIQNLIAENGEEIEIKLIAAHRRDVRRTKDTNEYHRIGVANYTERIKERLILQVARFNSYERKLYREPGIEVSDALVDPRLMLSDAICHTWYTRENRYSLEKQEGLEDTYKKGYLITALEHGSWENLQSQLLRGDISGAIFEWYSNNDGPLRERSDLFYKSLRNIFLASSIKEKKAYFDILSNQIDVLTRNDTQYKMSKMVLEGLEKEFIPFLKEIEASDEKFIFDIHFHLLTIATHMGDIAYSSEQRVKCNKLINKFASRLETLDFYIAYKIREVSHLMNMYDFETAIELSNGLSNRMENIIQMMNMVVEDDTEAKDFKSDNYGKILGTRLQARTFLINRTPEMEDLARKDSEKALLQFEDEVSRNRQYLYRAQLEYTSGNLGTAIECLGKAYGLDSSVNIKSLLENILRTKKEQLIFGLLHYTKIMSLAGESDTDLAREMMKQWNGLEAGIAAEINELKEGYPYNVMYWKLASANYRCKKISEGNKYFEKAKLSTEGKAGNLTVATIGLGIAMERASLIIKDETNFEITGRVLEETIAEYQSFMERELPESMVRYFEPWKDTLEDCKNCEAEAASKKLLKLSKDIPY